MCDLEICRICLRKGVKLYDYEQYYLKQYYEEVMGKKVKTDDSLPHFFCYVCAAILYKFHKFKEKCHNGDKIFQQLAWSGPITLRSISQIDKQSTNLQSPLQFITINKRIRTCLVKHKIKTQNIVYDVTETQIPEIEDSGSDSAPENRTLAEIKTEPIHKNKESVEAEENGIEIEISLDEKVSEELTVLPLEDDNIFCEEDSIESVNDAEKITKEVKIVIEDIYKANKTNKVNDEAKPSKSIKRKKGKKSNEVDSQKKPKKFEKRDPLEDRLADEHWVKMRLTEEEALEQFKARGQDKKYLDAAYHCIDCYKGFTKEDMLERHKISRHSERIGPIECRFCKMRFKQKNKLCRHIEAHYTKYTCLRCGLVCPLLSTAVLHNEYHNGVKRQCKYCGKEFTHQSTYYTHLRTHRSEHVCTLCGASFVSKLGLHYHKKKLHVNAVAEVPQGEEQYCQQCHIKFETRKAYEEHLKHSAKHDSFGNKKHGEKQRQPRIPTDCNICGKHFATQAACRKHHLVEHPGCSFFAPNERKICEICGISLAPGSVENHVNTHTRKNLYPCNVCGRQFSSTTGRSNHMLTHSSEKKAACPLCDKRFKQKGSMWLHYRTFHLKEPYPKRNRNKKMDELTNKTDHKPHEDSDDNMPLNNFYNQKYY